MQEPKFRIETPVFAWIILPDFAGYSLFSTPFFSFFIAMKKCC